MGEDYEFDQTRDDPKDLISFHELAMRAFGLVHEKNIRKPKLYEKKCLWSGPEILRPPPCWHESPLKRE